VLSKKPQNNLQVTKNCASDTTKAIVDSLNEGPGNLKKNLVEAPSKVQ
jgi:hypothetical protein